METFLIRVWSPADGQDAAAADGMRGVASHVASGQEVTFKSETELLEFVRLLAGPAARRL